MNPDTIFALSSGPGKSGVAVIRISGNNLTSRFANIIGNRGSIRQRHAYFTNLRDGDGKLIDQCITLYFQAPSSFTGQDVIEIHSHGATAVIEKIFDYLHGLGFRMADPGEFSKRAFYNGKMDMSEIDGLAALLDARTDKQRRLALKSMTGGDSAVYESWRRQMIEISAYAAAILDYPSDDLPKNIGAQLLEQTRGLYDEINSALSGYAAVRAVRSGFNIVLTGDTNVGKSSLFNRLAGYSRAIVSDIPGTTRDVVGIELDIDGYLVHLSDTAGIRESSDTVESMGVMRAREEIENADLILRVYAGNAGEVAATTDNEITVFNKSDLNPNGCVPDGAISVSALTGDGVSELLDAVKQKIQQQLNGAESDLAISERARALLTDAAERLGDALSVGDANYDLFADHVRAAADAAGKILGVIGANEIADAIFGQLCLGK